MSAPGSRPTAVKKSVTVDPDVLAGLSAERRLNLSAAVNDGLELLAALDNQRRLVNEWIARHGEFTSEEMRPFLIEVLEANIENLGRRSARRVTGDRTARRRASTGASVPGRRAAPRGASA